MEDKNTERVYMAWQYLGVIIMSWLLLYMNKEVFFG